MEEEDTTEEEATEEEDIDEKAIKRVILNLQQSTGAVNAEKH